MVPKGLGLRMKMDRFQCLFLQGFSYFNVHKHYLEILPNDSDLVGLQQGLWIGLEFYYSNKTHTKATSGPQTTL